MIGLRILNVQPVETKHPHARQRREIQISKSKFQIFRFEVDLKFNIGILDFQV